MTRTLFGNVRKSIGGSGLMVCPIVALNQKMAELERVQTYLRCKLALVRQKEHLLAENITNTNCTWK